jgi:FkbM family methyltransferase
VNPVGIEASYQQIRRWGRRVFDTFFCSCDSRLVPFGKECVWHVRPDLLNADSIVVSAGVGNDISFEKELVDYIGCQILLLDPSPTGLRTMSLASNQRPAIEFQPVALAGRDGAITLQAPLQAAEGSYWLGPSGRPGQSGNGDTIQFPCRSLSSLARERGWSRIDLLKIDIEASEYAVVEDLVQSGLQVGQLCIEFHHFMQGVPITRTLRALEALRGLGLRFAYKTGSDYTLLSVS